MLGAIGRFEGEHPYVFYDGMVLFREGEVMIRRQLKCR